MADLQYIYHRTKIEYLDNIIKTKYIYNQVDRKKYEIYNINEGHNNRKYGHANISLKYKKYWQELDEAYGIFFRPYLDKPKLKINECAIILDFQQIINNNSIKYNINSTENNGFYLDKPGYERMAPYGGEYGITYNSTNIKTCKLTDLNIDSEILLQDSIYITPYLIDIIKYNE
jgi:hypothetical protein